jgi:hypothetical protein
MSYTDRKRTGLFPRASNENHDLWSLSESLSIVRSYRAAYRATVRGVIDRVGAANRTASLSTGVR